jgi:tetraacyldisaccharide-1-P 4'-kinase
LRCDELNAPLHPELREFADAKDVVPVIYRQSAIFPAPHWLADVSPDWQRSVVVVVGIARPERLLDSLKRGGIVVKNCIIVRDHEKHDADRVKKECAEASAIITTPKDYWRDPSIFSSLPVVTMLADVEADISLLVQSTLWKKTRPSKLSS